MRRSGTVASWVPRGQEGSIFFPETELEINGEKKKRGGAFVCCPIFGPMPMNRFYAGTDLPQHGLLRRHHESDKSCLVDAKDCAKTTVEFDKPWPHEVVVKAHVSEDGKGLTHTVIVNKPKESGEMPISFGFHPYFRTYGAPFKIEHCGLCIKGKNLVEGSATKIFRHLDSGLVLTTKECRIEMKSFGYTHYVIWTDNRSEYVCIEPVRYGRNMTTLFLKGGDKLTGRCVIRVFPR